MRNENIIDRQGDRIMELKASTIFTVRFSEVDSMNIVWHGNYALYFEEAREAFGKRYGIDYLTIFSKGFYTPLVDFHVEYKHPLIYGDEARIDIIYKDSESAKIIFLYEIYNLKTNKLIATGNTTQVFLDKNYNLVLYAPDFFIEWKKCNGLIYK